jgi:hypothetical protein
MSNFEVSDESRCKTLETQLAAAAPNPPLILDNKSKTKYNRQGLCIR